SPGVLPASKRLDQPWDVLVRANGAEEQDHRGLRIDAQRRTRRLACDRIRVEAAVVAMRDHEARFGGELGEAPERGRPAGGRQAERAVDAAGEGGPGGGV